MRLVLSARLAWAIRISRGNADDENRSAHYPMPLPQFSHAGMLGNGLGKWESAMRQVTWHNARQAALCRLITRLDHGLYKGRCLWRNQHQFDWINRLSAAMGECADGRQNRLINASIARAQS